MKVRQKLIRVSLIFVFLSLITNCGNQMSAQQNEDSNSQNNNLNSNKSLAVKYEAENEAKLKELDKQNEKFRQVPDEWKKVDFKNFSYPFVRLKNGEAEETEKNYAGGTRYKLGDVFYTDLNGDTKKEAIVFVWRFICGGSCDSGNAFISVISLSQGKTKIFWKFKTGGVKYGCGLKSFSLKPKKIVIEEFGNCQKVSDDDLNSKFYNGSFQSKDITKMVFSFSDSKPKKEATDLIETKIMLLLNYLPEISINE